MRFTTLLLTATALVASTPVPGLAQPAARPVVTQNRPTTIPPQRIYPARCRIRPNGEFPEAVAIAPVALAAGTETRVTLTDSSGSHETSLLTSAAVARGAEYVVAVSVGSARSCTAVVYR